MSISHIMYSIVYMYAMLLLYCLASDQLVRKTMKTSGSGLNNSFYIVHSINDTSLHVHTYTVQCCIVMNYSAGLSWSNFSSYTLYVTSIIQILHAILLMSSVENGINQYKAA